MNIKNKKLLSFGKRKFYSLLLTSSISMIIIFVMLLSDTIIAGHFIGENGVAAVNLVLPIYSIAAFLMVLVDIGTISNHSNEMGKFNQKRANEYFSLAVILLSIGGIILYIFTLFGEKLYFSLLDPSDEILSLTKAYYVPYPYIALLYPISGFLVDMVYADGDEFICNICYIVQIIGNIVASIILCKLYGIIGISYGTLISTIIPIFLALLHFLRKSNSLHFVWHFSLKDTWQIIKYGITDGLQYFYISILVFVLNMSITHFFGSVYLPIVTIAVNIIELALVFDGIGQAFTPLIGVYFGEKNYRGVKDIMTSCNKTALFEGIIFSAILFILAPYLPKLYGIDDTAMLPEYIIAIRIIATTFTFAAFEYVYSSYYILIEKLKIAIIMTTLYNIVIPLTLGILLGMIMGINGYWVSLALAPVLALIIPGLMLLKEFNIKSLPLLFSKNDIKKSKDFDIELSTSSSIKLRNNIEAYLEEKNIEKDKILKISLMIEECLLLIRTKNKNKKVYVQCSVFVCDKIRIIIRDTGIIFDLTDPDLNITSTNAFLVGILMSELSNKHNLTTIGYNRNELVF